MISGCTVDSSETSTSNNLMHDEHLTLLILRDTILKKPLKRKLRNVDNLWYHGQAVALTAI